MCFNNLKWASELTTLSSYQTPFLAPWGHLKRNGIWAASEKGYKTGGWLDSLGVLCTLPSLWWYHGSSEGRAKRLLTHFWHRKSLAQLMKSVVHESIVFGIARSLVPEMVCNRVSLPEGCEGLAILECVSALCECKRSWTYWQSPDVGVWEPSWGPVQEQKITTCSALLSHL